MANQTNLPKKMDKMLHKLASLEENDMRTGQADRLSRSTRRARQAGLPGNGARSGPHPHWKSKNPPNAQSNGWQRYCLKPEGTNRRVNRGYPARAVDDLLKLFLWSSGFSASSTNGRVQPALKAGASIDLQRLESYLHGVQESGKSLQDESEGRFSRSMTMLNNSRDDMREQLGKAATGLTSIQINTDGTFLPAD